jgi:hypothetical protein
METTSGTVIERIRSAVKAGSGPELDESVKAWLRGAKNVEKNHTPSETIQGKGRYFEADR